jgi:hypothetical protein
MTNRRQNAYYVPEVEMVMNRYQEFQADPTALKQFVDQQQTLASQMMDVSRIYKARIKFLALLSLDCD